MQHRLLIDLDAHDGALVRVLALIERRGFTLQKVDANSLTHGSPLHSTAMPAVALVVAGPSTIDVLVRQVQRLINVRDVHVTPNPTTEEAQ